jgi:hypothetical protein
MSEAFDEISMAREGLVKAWASTTTMMMKTRNKDGDEYNESHSCYWNSKSRDAGSSEGGQQRRRRTQQIDGLNNMVDGSNNLDDDNNDGEGDDGWWQSIIPLAANNDTVAKTPRTTIDNDQFVNVNKNDNNKMVPLTQDEQRTFDTVHLEYTTAIFGDELDAIRQGKLEEYCITKNKNKASSSSSRKEANNTKDKTVIKNASGDVELDHTHYSFVVPTSKGKRRQGEGGLDTLAMTTSSAVASNVDVQVLSNMLHSWADVHTLTEQRMLLGSQQTAQQQQQQQQLIPSGASSELLITPHARQKCKVGFLSVDDIEIQRN